MDTVSRVLGLVAALGGERHYNSVRSIAAQLCVSETAVRLAISSLRRSGLVKCERIGGVNFWRGA